MVNMLKFCKAESSSLSIMTWIITFLVYIYTKKVVVSACTVDSADTITDKIYMRQIIRSSKHAERRCKNDHRTLEQTRLLGRRATKKLQFVCRADPLALRLSQGRREKSAVISITHPLSKQH